MVAGLGLADGAVADVELHALVGLTYTWLVRGRDEDIVGLMASQAGLSDESGAGFAKDELAIELFYELQLTPWLSVKPGLQYIVNPSGSQTADDVLVGSLRFALEF